MARAAQLPFFKNSGNFYLLTLNHLYTLAFSQTKDLFNDKL